MHSILSSLVKAALFSLTAKIALAALLHGKAMQKVLGYRRSAKTSMFCTSADDKQAMILLNLSGLNMMVPILNKKQ